MRTALLEGITICATLNLRIQALKRSRYKAGYIFEGCYFGAIMGTAKIAKIKCLKKYQLYSNCIAMYFARKDLNQFLVMQNSNDKTTSYLDAYLPGIG